MTLEEFILGRSPLEKNGTRTLLQHLMALQMEIHGKWLEVEVETVEDTSEVSSTSEVVTVESVVSEVVVESTEEEIESKEE